MNSNNRADGIRDGESQTDFDGTEDMDRSETGQDQGGMSRPETDQGQRQEGMSTSELLDRQEGHASTQTMEGQRPGQNRMDGNSGGEQAEEPLVADSTGLNERWKTLQIHFVDEPKDAVREADGLVAEVIQKLTERFAEERDNLEKQWQSGSEVSTEDLRVALRHYRSFFQRLLAA